MMNFYYQYEKNGLLPRLLNVRVKSSRQPLDAYQIRTDTALPEGIKMFDPVKKEVTFFKNIYDDIDGDIIDTIEDTDIPRQKIDDINILEKK